MRKPSAETIRKAVEKKSGEIVEWLKTLIAFPSENRFPYGQEKEAQEFLGAECEKLGLAIDIFSPEKTTGIQKNPYWLKGRNYENGRKNMVAHWKGSSKGKSLLLSGHIDVAPYEPDDWKICHPFAPVVKGNRLYGRGSADMKGGLAASFWALKILREMGFEPLGDVLFESVVDEEFAGGNGALASRLRGYNADLCVLGEPTGMEVCPACLGALLGDIFVRGKAGMPYTATVLKNPITAAARVVELFGEWEKKWRAANRHPLFCGPSKKLKAILWRLDSGQNKEFAQMGIPLSVKLSWIVWCYPGIREEKFYESFKSFWKEKKNTDVILSSYDLDIKRDFHYVRPWETDLESPGLGAIVKAFEDYERKKPVVSGAPFSCDMALYADAGNMATVILGPGGDALHAPDEWVNIDHVLSLTGILANLIVAWCGVEHRKESEKE